MAITTQCVILVNIAHYHYIVKLKTLEFPEFLSELKEELEIVHSNGR